MSFMPETTARTQAPEVEPASVADYYGTRVDGCLAPLIEEPYSHAVPVEFRREQLRSSLRTEALLEAILAKLDSMCVPPERNERAPSISPAVAAPVAPLPVTKRRPGGAR